MSWSPDQFQFLLEFAIQDWGISMALSDMHNSDTISSQNETIPVGPEGIVFTSAYLWAGNIGTGIASSWILSPAVLFSSFDDKLNQAAVAEKMEVLLPRQ